MNLWTPWRFVPAWKSLGWQVWVEESLKSSVLPTSSRDSSPFRMLLHGSYSESDDQSILLPRSSAFTGCASQTLRRWLRSRSTARSTLYSRQTGVLSCRRQHVEWPSIPHHICIVTCGLQTASQDFPRLSFLPGHPYMTYLSLLIITSYG